MTSREEMALPRRQMVISAKLVPVGETLPVWSSVGLDTKLPIVPSPRGAYTLYTTRMGQPKYISKQKYDFDVSRPWKEEGQYEYNALHDPSLRGYLSTPQHRELLLRQGLITQDGRVTCSLREFNQYRRYLYQRGITDFMLEKKRDKRIRSEATMSWSPRQDVSRQQTPAERSSTASTMAQISLVRRLRRREEEFERRLAERRRKQIQEHEHRLQESWEERIRRQTEQLEREKTLRREMRRREKKRKEQERNRELKEEEEKEKKEEKEEKEGKDGKEDEEQDNEERDENVNS